ncbi:MAG: tryptophan synthase subunit alpha [Myxococcales bacterium]|nr:tryptophan synthase subunit alpha [Myxococcales bacterium]MCB9644283.1 tryptophan synthase subunit alpha [Myxococcales bacterium]
MNRIEALFARTERKVLSMFTTAGYPALDDTLRVCRALQDAGVEMIELGFPFSDPLADGPTIQRSNEQALANGMSLKVLFGQLKALRDNVDIPVLLMGYLNPVLQYGVERFCAACAEVGIDGLILPDMPVDEYKETYQALFAKYDLRSVFLVTPQTSPERIRMLDEITTGFLYVVSVASVTGNKLAVDDTRKQYFQRIHEMKLKSPTMVGFGIHDRQSFEESTAMLRGGIIGSALLKVLETSKDIEADVRSFVADIRPVV